MVNPVEFVVLLEDLKSALSVICSSPPSGELPDLVEFAVEEDYVSWTARGLHRPWGLGFPAKVTTRGVAVVPFYLIERLLGWLKEVRTKSVTIVIGFPEIKVGAFKLRDPLISSRPELRRTVNVAADASLLELLRVSVKYSAEELEANGLSERTSAAWDEAEKYICPARESLGSIGIRRFEVTDFVCGELLCAQLPQVSARHFDAESEFCTEEERRRLDWDRVSPQIEAAAKALAPLGITRAAIGSFVAGKLLHPVRPLSPEEWKHVVESVNKSLREKEKHRFKDRRLKPRAKH
jgi:hypothetical protein